ncbi:acyltransferase family protein [Streptomyces sp. NPDC059173]|uniref:acyltransferase family protein n=1 Tax=Streptomyces sp. NPDC059173 TaxID=3346756 RepID=UPI0036B472B8
MQEQSTPLGGRGHVPGTDGLRAVAALMVLVLHLAGWTGIAFDPRGAAPAADVLSRLAVAVHVFFVISGFLLYRPYAAAALAGRAAPPVRAYYRSRFLRIWPAYTLLVLVSLVCFHREVLTEAPRLLRILTLQHIYADGDFPHTRAEPWSAFSQTWSLGTEASFYLLLPLLALLLHRATAVRRGPGPVLAAFVLAGVLSLLWQVALSAFAAAHEAPTLMWWLPGYLVFFLAGMALGAVAVHAETAGGSPVVRLVRRFPLSCWGVALAGYAVLASPLAGGHMTPPSPAQAVVESLAYLVVSGGLVLPVVLAPDSGPARLLSRPVVTWLGRISYGIFLWHMFVMAVALRVAGLEWGEAGLTGFLVLLPLTAAVSVLLAWLSFRYVEEPLRQWNRRRTAPPATASRDAASGAEGAAPSRGARTR